MSSDIIIRNGRIWPSAYADIIDGADLLICDGRIAKIGRVRDAADTKIDAQGGLVMPGFIQTHIHCAQTLFRGLAEDLPLLPWLKQYIWPLEAAHTEDTIRLSTRLTCAELIRSGVTSFLSFETVRHTEAVIDEVRRSGLSAIVSHCLMDETGGYEPLAADIDEALGYCDRILDGGLLTERLQLAVAPRFALSCSAENMRIAAAYARDRGLLIHSHAAEQIPEVEQVMEITGLRNIEYLDEIGLTGNDVCLAHCVHTNRNEREILRDSGTKVLHCPSANMKLGSGIAPTPEYLDMGINVSLGSDGAPCNNRLDIFTEMRAAGLLQKLRLGPEALPASDIVHMATLAGAAAMGWSADTGSLKEGKRADLIVIDADAPNIQPFTDPAAAVVYACDPSNVSLTMAAGHILYENGEFTGSAESLEEINGHLCREHCRKLCR